MLIIHSEEDLRCPIIQAEELFVALRLLGKDVTFYRFPGESHELSRSGSPVHRRMRAEIILDFFTEKLAPRRRRSSRAPPSRASASISLRAMEMPGGIIGSASRRYHWASAISVGSQHDVAADVAGPEADHQAVRERPRLAALVADVGDVEADLLAHLADHGALERLARLDEAGEARVHRARSTARRGPAAPPGPDRRRRG